MYLSLVGASDRENITNCCSQFLRFVPLLLQIATFGSESVHQDCSCVNEGTVMWKNQQDDYLEDSVQGEAGESKGRSVTE